jgi:hypothetical protein
MKTRDGTQGAVRSSFPDVKSLPTMTGETISDSAVRYAGSGTEQQDTVCL